MYCSNCSTKLSDKAVSCPKCGHPVRGNGQKQAVVAFLLCFFLGVFGAHRFYAGKTGSAIAQLILTLTVFGLIVSGIWAFIDGIVIICGNFTDNNDKKIAW
ncbi:MAG: NINE protein [Rickettsiales bacterium]|jgi:TM2 domain-containing membrane protein YozV|nr:NINE protein [Rickettsiales bacterium]